jgi:hypothetical protein
VIGIFSIAVMTESDEVYGCFDERWVRWIGEVAEHVDCEIEEAGSMWYRGTGLREWDEDEKKDGFLRRCCEVDCKAAAVRKCH